jgi:MFS family permease
MRLGEGLREHLTPFRGVLVNANLRRLQLAWAGSITAEWGYAIVLSVFAYHAGGATAVGMLMLVRMLSSAAAAPFMSVLGDRHNRAHVMVLADLVRATALAAAGLVALADAPAVAIYVLAVLVAIVQTAFHPAQAALTPSLARTPEELTAANAVSSTIESVGTFLGPALGGLLLAAASTGVVFIVMAGLFLWSAFFVLRIHAPAAPELASGAKHPPFLHQAAEGIKTIVREPNVRLIIGVYGCQTLVAGALRVFIVVMAFQLLDTGNAGVGFLNSATGIGGILGGVATIAIVSRSRLATDFGVGVALWGLPIALIGIWPNQWFALTMLAVVGIANTIVDVAAFTLLQRAVPDEVLARVFGVLQSVLYGTIGLGSVLASALVSGLGARTTLIVAGAFLPMVALITYRRMLAIDRAVAAPAPERLELLQSNPIFVPLPLPVLERLARSLVPVHLEAGATLFQQGDHGDRFYLVRTGELEILVGDGPPKVEGQGGSLGEIALLHDIPRTATVSARTDSDLYALEREEFLAAVTGHAESKEAADAVVGSHLGVTTA